VATYALAFVTDMNALLPPTRSFCRSLRKSTLRYRFSWMWFAKSYACVSLLVLTMNTHQAPSSASC